MRRSQKKDGQTYGHSSVGKDGQQDAFTRNGNEEIRPFGD